MDLNNTTYANATSSICIPLVDKANFTNYSLVAAAGIIFILSFFEKRKSSKHQRCGNRPGILVPANLLDGHTDPLGYAAAFGCTASSCLTLIFYGTDSNNIPQQEQQTFPAWAQLFLWIFIVLGIGVSYYPFFACLSSRCLVVGSFIGFCYSLIWFLVHLDGVIECPTEVILFEGEEVVIQLPVFVCFLFLVLKFAYNFGREIYTTIKRKVRRKEVILNYTSFEDIEENNNPELKISDLAEEYQLKYVRSLLQKSEAHTQNSNIEVEILPIHRAIQSHCCKRNPTFRYSPKIIATFTVAVVCVYELGFRLLLSFASLLNLSYEFLSLNKESLRNSSEDVYKQLHLFAEVTTISGTTAIGLSTVIITFHIFNIFRSYREHLLRLYKGDFSQVPMKMWNISSSETMTYSLHYAGIQISVLLLGYSVLMLVIYVVGLVIAYLLVLPMLGLVPQDLLRPFYAIVPAKIITVAFFYVQRLICHKILLPKTQSHSTTNGKTRQVLAVNNRRTYHNFSYFMFFLYIILGAYKSFERITKGIFLGTLFLGRMDKSALMQGYENWDNGYMAYLSFLRMELTHCHPALVVFCHHMQKVRQKKHHYGACLSLPNTANSDSRSASPMSSSVSSQYQETPQSINTYERRIQNRWLKCYTLINNPDIVDCCKRCISKE